MPIIHGEGHHHSVHWRHQWKFVKYVKHLVSQLLGHNDYEKLKKFFDRSIIFVGMISPIMTVPQVWKVWEDQSTVGLVLAPWITYLCVTSFWLAYGILHRERPIILINTTWIFVHIAMLVGMYMYS